MSGKSFNLNHAENNQKFNIYHVKLTESAIKAFENACKQPKLRPKIRFSESTGEISVPTYSSEKIFTFSLSSTDDGKSSFECVKMDKFQMCSLGNMPLKMTIHGNDDVFSMTKQKFDHLEDEQRKSSTKVLKSASNLKKKSCPSSISKIKQQLLSDNSSKKAINPLKQQVVQSKQVRGATPIKGSTPHEQSVANKPLKERIIHLLAVRNYNKPELIIRLSKDGLQQPERSMVEDLAQQVAVLDRRNQYVLKPQILAQVNEKDWAPFYTHEDLQLLRDRKSALEPKQSSLSSIKHELGVTPKSKQAAAAPGTGTGVRSSIRAPFAPHPLATKIKALDLLDSGLSPLAVSLQMHLSESLILMWRDKAESLREMHMRKRQRQGNLATGPEPLPKSPRLSNSATVSNTQSFTLPVHSNQSFSTTPPNRQLDSPHSEKENQQVQSPPSPCSTGTPRSMSSTQCTPNTSTSESVAGTNNTSKISPVSTLDDQTAVTKPFQPRSNISSCDLEIPEDMEVAQLRDHLKRQFNRIYPDYTRLYNLIHEKSRQIEVWDQQLQALSIDSPEYDMICDSIIKMYNEVKNPEFKAQSERLQLLHEKLSLYKKRIRQLDSEVASSEGSKPSLNKITAAT